MKNKILVVDDSVDILNIYKTYLGNKGYEIITAENGKEALEFLKTEIPNLILLDIIMPQMNGYEVCKEIRINPKTTNLPVIFASSLESEQDKAMAFQLGADDYLNKPFKKDELLSKVEKVIKKHKSPFNAPMMTKRISKLTANNKGEFIDYLMNKLGKEYNKSEIKLNMTNIYEMTEQLAISSSILAKFLSEFTGIKYVQFVDPESLELGEIPTSFAQLHKVLPIREQETNKIVYVISNPFDIQVVDSLGITSSEYLRITEPENILPFLEIPAYEVTTMSVKDKLKSDITVAPSDVETHPVIKLANMILYKAISQRASDIHIEPKENNTEIRFRIDGELVPPFTLSSKSALKVISRFKSISGLDIAEHRKPQDGAFTISMLGKQFKLRVATTSTPYGESAIIRILDLSSKPKALSELGMTLSQENIMKEIATQSGGFILIVGPTGAGKTTTNYSLINQIDVKKRSLITIEDPIEYRIAGANQQQLNEKAGITFEALLKSAMRQDPDILYIGEIRDSFSANAAIEAASTGHLTVSTLHTTNTTSAIFRLEMLNVPRSLMADALLCVISQKLLKVLCPYCKVIRKPSIDEINIMKKFTEDIPSQVAEPKGCAHCNNTGYHGREAIYEILKFDSDISNKIRADESINSIRKYIIRRGDFMIADHAIQKIKDLKCTVIQINNSVLLEEVDVAYEKNKLLKLNEDVEKDVPIHSQSKHNISKEGKKNLLVVEDDRDIQLYIKTILENNNYSVDCANDGIDALMRLGTKNYDLILSDINMPNMDGIKLLEIKNLKGLNAPVIFITAETSEESELSGLKLGAVDYIKKPFKKELLLLRIKRILEE